jgi:hypothetical protein
MEINVEKKKGYKIFEKTIRSIELKDTNYWRMWSI